MAGAASEISAVYRCRVSKVHSGLGISKDLKDEQALVATNGAWRIEKLRHRLNSVQADITLSYREARKGGDEAAFDGVANGEVFQGHNSGRAPKVDAHESLACSRNTHVDFECAGQRGCAI